MQEFNTNRRRFLSMAALTIAGGHLSASAAEPAQTTLTRTFGALKQVDAGVLSVGYAESRRDHPEARSMPSLEARR